MGPWSPSAPACAPDRPDRPRRTHPAGPAGPLFNLLNDSEAWANTPRGSAAEAELQKHINEQTEKMTAQEQTVKDELSACKTAVS